MKKILFLILLFPLISLGQKKPLDHSVYDEWQKVNDKLLSNDGKWVVYTITPQEGDGNLYIQSAKNPSEKLIVPRGDKPVITYDSRYVILKINPRFADVRQAKIKKKKPEEMPKDSMAIVDLTGFQIRKVPSVQSFKTPEKGAGWMAFQKEPVNSSKHTPATSKAMDSLKKKIDSLTNLVRELETIKSNKKDDESFAQLPPETPEESKGGEVVLVNLSDNKEVKFHNVKLYEFDQSGSQLALYLLKSPEDSNSLASVVLYNLKSNHADTILRGGNDFKNLTFSEDGKEFAFLAERGKNKKALQKFYELYLFRSGQDTAYKIIDTLSQGMPAKNTVSENGNLRFSKDGSRLFFGTAPIKPPKDTTLIEMDQVKLDIWNYKDDYLQSQQLVRLKGDQRKNYQAMYDLQKKRMIQLGSEGLPTVIPTDEGNGNYFIAITDTGRRIASQWEGFTLQDIYSIDVNTGQKKLVKKNLQGRVYPSSTGKYILMYDDISRNYFVWDGMLLKNITASIKVPLYNEENDVPAAPNAYGVVGWLKGDEAVYIYDRYDIWKVDPTAKVIPVRITPDGRIKKTSYRYIQMDREERFLTIDQPAYFRIFNEVNKDMGLSVGKLADKLNLSPISYGAYQFGNPTKQKDGSELLYTKENYVMSPDLYYYDAASGEKKLTSINPQQSQYVWSTAELYHWVTFTGKKSTGILYKPEDFDSTKKYPVIFYFYETLSDGLNTYIPPAPTPSRLNISFFVSRGYLVFAPDIHYTIGHPGKSAYDYIVSAAKSLQKKKWVDSKNMGIQGQSWGGYQVAYLITATNIFKAAWAGAPVVNMFSAYGGIRWQSGMNRQFQYEKTQSRIGATIWDRPDLYTENSPLFHLKNVKTPVVIMANDADGAVPWYQGIEMFTALRRLGKPVWFLNYNGEAHNLVERKNRKDISIREQQFFDWLLKGAKAPKWISEGVPAVEKGIDLGLGY